MKKNDRRAYRIKNMILGWGLSFSILLVVIVIIAVEITTSGAIQGVVQKDILVQTNKIASLCEWIDHIPSVPDQFVPDYRGFSYVILSKDNDVADGELPLDITASELNHVEHLDDKYTGSHHYHILHLRLHERPFKASAASGSATALTSSGEDSSTLRASIIVPHNRYDLYGIIDYESIDTVYHNIRLLTILIALSVMVLMIITCIIMSRLVTKNLSDVTGQAAEIVSSEDYSKTIDPGRSFEEIDILVDTCNHLLNRVNRTIKQQQQFNHDISHELRTPLTVLKAQCQLTRDQFKDNEDALLTLDVIERQVDRMNTLIRLLLGLSRLEQNRIYTETEVVSLNEVIQSICDDISLISDKDEDDLFTLTMESIDINANTDLIFMLLRNIIDNAVKYSNDDPHIDIFVYRLNEGVYIRVTDNGIGMTEDEISHIFDSFYRADSARSTEGFGLGLTLADRIVKLYNGNITIESQPGEGSIVTVFLSDDKIS